MFNGVETLACAFTLAREKLISPPWLKFGRMATRQHHYVPQFHLRQWIVGEGDSIGVLDKTDPRVFLANPKDVGGEQFFYSKLPEAQVIERYFANIEGKASVLYGKIEKSMDLAVLTDVERFDLCHYIAAAICPDSGGQGGSHPDLRRTSE